MNNLTRKIIPTLMHVSGLNALSRRFLDRRLFVIMYHSVHDASDRTSRAGILYPHITLEAAAFESQMRLLYKNGHTFITPAALPDMLRNGALPKKPTIVYFDDGYRDNLTVALPILEKYAIPATVFLTTGFAERTHLLWTVELRAIFEKNGRRSDEAAQAIDRLKKLRDEERRREVERTYGQLSPEERQALFNEYLTWDEVRQLAARGVEIGSHTVSHPRLTECGEDQLAHELGDSKLTIEKHLRKSVFSFSYPHGRQDARTNAAAVEAGYGCVVSLGTGLNDPARLAQPPYFLKNAPIRIHEPLAHFETELYGRALFK